jgi:hypothetical protein
VSEDIKRIRRSQSKVAPHIMQRQTWKDTEFLLARIAELEAVVARVREVGMFRREYFDGKSPEIDAAYTQGRDSVIRELKAALAAKGNQ